MSPLPDMQRPSDHDRRLAVVRRYAGWWLGTSSWANDLVKAYLEPQQATDRLNADMAKWEEAVD